MGLCNICHEQNDKLAEENCRKIVSLLPQSSSSEEYIFFVKSIMPLLAISAVTVAGDDMAKWVATRLDYIFDHFKT